MSIMNHRGQLDTINNVDVYCAQRDPNFRDFFIQNIRQMIRLRTSDRTTGRPLRNGVAPLVEKDVGSSGTHFLLRHQVHAAVVIAVPLSIH